MVFIGTTLKSVIKYFRKKAVSSLDEESKWSVHYTAPWHQQENVFLPGSRPPCVEDLHQQAKVNFKNVLRECENLRKDGLCSSQYYSQSPAVSSPVLSDRQMDKDEREKKNKSSESLSEDETLAYSLRSQTPLLDNICDINHYNSWSKCLPLPTPEEKMKQQAQTVSTDIVPINITGESFDRQASFRRTIINTDTAIRRSKRVKRRKTITGVPDNIQRELATSEETAIRVQSMYMADQYSTISHAGCPNSTPRNSNKTGCKTDEVKILRPSMRRIRAQKGNGIAGQMANISLSSLGSISNMSDCTGTSYTPQINDTDQGFHSLPRPGARICIQQLEYRCDNSFYKISSESTSMLPHQVNIDHPSSDQQHMSDSIKDLFTSPKSNECQIVLNNHHDAMQISQSVFMDYNHNNSPISSPTTASATQQNLRNFGSVQSAQNLVMDESSVQSAPCCHLDSHISSTEFLVSAGSSYCQSTASLIMASYTDTESQCSPIDERYCMSSNKELSETSAHSLNTLTSDLWPYDIASNGQHTSTCSSPVSHLYNSRELSPSKTDSCSLFSLDTGGYDASKHLGTSLKSYSYGCINKAGKSRHNLYECREHSSQDDNLSLHSNRSLTRSISLRKAKKPPLPPKRTDSLQRKTQRKQNRSENVLNDQLMSSPCESLTSLSSSFSGQMTCSASADPWILRPRRPSIAIAASSEMSEPAAQCSITPTHSENDNTWDINMDFQGLCSTNHPTSPILDHKPAENSTGSDNRISSSDCTRVGIHASPKMATSQENVPLVTSPSSGYSSKSITPTLGTPVASLLRAKSPAGRPKPKVPERKSSLRSSVSSSNTSLSSINSDSIKNLPTPPPLPKTLPGWTSPTSSSERRLKGCLKTPPQSPLSCSAGQKQSSPKQTSSSPLTIAPDESESFFNFPPPVSEVSDLLYKMNLFQHPTPCTTTSAILNMNKQPPSLSPEDNLKEVTISQADLHVAAVKSENNLNSRQHEMPKSHQRPLITAQALQTIHLRPIKLMKLENIFTDIITTVCDPDESEPCQEPATSSDKSSKAEILEESVTSNSAKSLQNKMDRLECVLTESPLLASPSDVLLESSNMCEDLPELVHYLINTQSGENSLELPFENEPQSTSVCPNVRQCTPTPPATQDLLQNQNLYLSPKKTLQSASNGLDTLEVPSSSEHLEQEGLNNALQEEMVNLEEILSQLEIDVENLTSSAPSKNSVSSEISSDSLSDLQLTAQTLHMQDTELSDCNFGLSEDKGIYDDSSSSSSGSTLFREEENTENDAAFDSSTDCSSPTSITEVDTIEEMMASAFPRNTEDLFAAIHRSKRKVLGRCDSEEERSRGSIPSPPVTPTSSCPTMLFTSRQSTSIQRSLRRSSTSNDSFKALLLKKGSRSEPGFRMSATEMLKFSDPRLQRSNTESSQTPCISPVTSRRAAEDWARSEGVLPRLSPSPTPSKYGRSSTPPSAASSRYNSRSRIPSGPMTVICEREGELAESTECSLNATIPYSVSLTSSGTVCAQGST